MTSLLKSLLIAASLIATPVAFAASPVTPVSASNNGLVLIDGADLSILFDGYIAPEGTPYQTDAVSWFNQVGSSGVTLDFDFGQLYTLSDVLIGVDHNDFYQVQVSLDGSAWNTLFTNLAFEGQSNFGSEIISSVAGDPEYQATIDFPTTVARYARIYAVSGDNAFSVSEVSFSGVAVVPEPETWALLIAGLGLIGAIAYRRS
ncbi:PEPxxWA-CTERM sorting domain-containing protein [Methyloversatilis sp. XJ19-49]|uniref:PEPxxWA-CTERM sorting domain-containing protein n=1 Tax=Methyloversatilis sp. XJ19-49 TaxID=2963429 RepID=UPI00211BEBE7|nr:PEPxxWA-CTERM sorting domain-containing protein [Methyloversatilis sp. XJ19-49]MCQ9376780.1 PEPxxWA-CTERM sorting domain-containing protein [Methyloversatilis sp. XJ19-49]